MTKNRRYEAHYDALNDQRIAEAATSVTLPNLAYGPEPIHWATPRDRPAVWAWIQWEGKPAERLAAVATGWNDRVVIVEWYSAAGARNTVVWRNAVTRREQHGEPRT
ncbi:hypothetical protein HF576_01785 [Microbacterium sp. CFH 90308]|uniref:Uncharacterized protein n=1 Tax=Microbacterium salsuginis TaxID=2722803 RepID=A0ABX1K944_9MICO|nr:hypothetical protein [Microbacterium sp. CFH 90308]NLP82569.1 hypothetical protein [Microbacterium sp. CFH 90308]